MICGLGDGIAAVRQADGQMKTVIGKRNGFSNETLGLGLPHRLTDWRWLTIEPFEPGMTVLLATDGIGDDLLEDRVPDFIAWLLHQFAPRKPQERHRALRHELENWPTPSHQDDKTLAVLYRV
jgi:hypothetical protein